VTRGARGPPFGRGPRHPDPHLTCFSPATLTRLLDETGLAVREIRSFGRIFTYGYWLSRVSAYPAPLRAVARMGVRLFGRGDEVPSIDTRDSMEVVAVRRPQ
jgi:hypothetical protein